MAPWVATSRSEHLKRRPRQDTAPELMLRRSLHRLGARFRLHRKIAKGCTADIVLPSRKLAVFVDGDYWHCCPVHGKYGSITGPNATLWTEKFRRNRERDALATEKARAAGWRVVRVRECSIRHDSHHCARLVLDGVSPPPIESG